MSDTRTVTTRFLSVDCVARLIAVKGLGAVIEGMASYLVADFCRWPDFQKSPRVAHHSPSGVIELMPISDAHLYSFKYVNGHPQNHRFGMPTVMAFGVLADVSTGAPKWLSELTLTTALRTATTSAVAARVLARPDSRCMALIGNGAQSEFQAVAFNRLLGVNVFHLYDIDPDATHKLMSNLSRLGLNAQSYSCVADAVKGCDIVTTLTANKGNAAVLTPDLIEAGMHINAIGGDCPGKTELHRGVLDMARVFVEYEPQSRVEGDVQQVSPEFEVVELWQVLAGQQPGRIAPDEVTVFDSVGFALEDYSALRYMSDLAAEAGAGESIALIPALTDPKNLFGLLLDSAHPSVAMVRRE